MLLLIVNSSSTTGLSMLNKYVKAERLFIILFVIDMFVKILFHFNGHKYSNDKFLVSDSNNGQIEETTNDT